MSDLSTVQKLKEELDSLRPLKPEDEIRVMQKFRLDWNYHSNNLEGNSLTYGETKALILFNITAQGKPLQDHFEITGHNEAIKWVIDIVKQNVPLTENFIRQIHELLLKEPYEVDSETPDGKPSKKTIQVGTYKTSSNHVKTVTGEIFRFTSPEETPAKMHDLIQWYRKKLDEEDVNGVLLAAEFHYKFIRIHPFDDGNGRTARILMNFILMQFGYPPVIIKTEDKENYFAALRQADAGIFDAFADYIIQNLIHSLTIMIAGARGENIEEPDDIDKEVALIKQKLKAVNQKVKFIKSEEAILEVYNGPLKKMHDILLKKEKSFLELYSGFKFDISLDGNLSRQVNDEIYFKTQSQYISKQTDSIKLSHQFLNFKHDKIKPFNHVSIINFNFDYKEYSVSIDGSTFSLKKLYHISLTDDEIQQIVSIVNKNHVDFINKKIAEFE